MIKVVLNYQRRVEVEIPVLLGRGAVAHLPEILRDARCDMTFVVADKNAHLSLGPVVEEYLPASTVVSQPAGEEHKTLSALERLSDEFFAAGGTKKSCIVAFGGGMVGNLAGLLASLTYRGVRLIHVPTTLIGQLDSAVDVKQSVNARVKNAIGAYYPPHAVVIDPNLLRTLPERQLRSGLAEAMKHGFAQDLGLVQRALSTSLDDVDDLEELIASTLRLKIQHYHDTEEKWDRRIDEKLLTHVGHTVGKAIESMYPGEFWHGEAISHGMVAECAVSAEMNLLTRSDVDRVGSALAAAGLLPGLPASCTAEKVLEYLVGQESQPTFALLGALGQNRVVSTAVPRAVVAVALESWTSVLRQ